MTRSLLFVALILAVSAGCRKVRSRSESDSGGNQGGSQGGSGFGAEQAVRKAVSRDDLLKALEQIRLFIDTASSDGTMPSVQTTYAALQKEAPQHAKLVDEQKIILHPARSREDVWAYALLPQGNYAIASASGVEHPVNQQTLNQRLGR